MECGYYMECGYSLSQSDSDFVSHLFAHVTLCATCQESCLPRLCALKILTFDCCLVKHHLPDTCIKTITWIILFFKSLFDHLYSHYLIYPLLPIFTTKMIPGNCHCSIFHRPVFVLYNQTWHLHIKHYSIVIVLTFTDQSCWKSPTLHRCVARSVK